MSKLTLSTIFFAASAIMAIADPKQPVVISGDSPFQNCILDTPGMQIGTVSIGSEVEPWVAVDPVNPDHIVASWQQDRWSTGGARGLVAGVTFDGGRNWYSAPLPGLTPCTGNDDFIRASDPWFTFAPNSDVYHISLVVSNSLIELLSGVSATGRSAMLVQKSANGGVTWSDPVALVDEDFNGLNDKEAITADPFDSNFVYAVWDRLDFGNGSGPTLFSRTTDGGETWDPPRALTESQPNRQTVGNQIVVAPDGTLLLFYADVLDSAQGKPSRLTLLRSSDHGASWSAPIVVSSIESSLQLFEPDSGEPIRAGGGLFDVAGRLPKRHALRRLAGRAIQPICARLDRSLDFRGRRADLDGACPDQPDAGRPSILATAGLRPVCCSQ